MAGGIEAGIDIRGDKEFIRKMKRFDNTKVPYKYAQGIGVIAKDYIKNKAVRASGGKPIKLKLTRRSGGGSITNPHTQIKQEGKDVVARVGMTGDKGELMKMHEKGGWFMRKQRAMSIVSTRQTRKAKSTRYHLPARPTFKRTMLFLQKEVPKVANKVLDRAIKAAGLK